MLVRLSLRSLFTLLAWMIGVGCSEPILLGDDVHSCLLEPPEDEAHDVSFVTFWTEGPESEALDVLLKRMQRLGGSLTSTLRYNRSDLQQDLFAENAELPDVYQVNGGSDVLQFALDAPGDSTRICALDSLYETYSLRELYFETTWRPSMCRGSHYAVPFTVHRANTLMLHTGLYARAQDLAKDRGHDLPDIEDMTSAEELITSLEWIDGSGLKSDSGKDVVPLSLGIWTTEKDVEERRPTNVWPITIVAYENLLASYPHSAYEKVWQGRGDIDSVRDELNLLTEHLERLGAVSNIRQRLTWQEAADRVVDGEAVLTINGDWIGTHVNQEDDDELDLLVFPNDQGNFVYTPDSFAVPRSRQYNDGSDAHGWIHDVAKDRETQLDFSAVKKSIPALRGLEDELERLDSKYLEETYLEFSSCQPDTKVEPRPKCRLLLASSGLAPGSGFDPCFDRTALLLAMIAGIEYEKKDFKPEDADQPVCDRDIPLTVAEAKEELLEVLEQYSREPFARDCR